MSVSLAKTPESIVAGQLQAAQNRALRKNGLVALQWEFADRIADAHEKAIEAKAEVLSK
ncbi:hypothetical protein [Streptomyces sp. NPDC059874]|uniref:hypothetical protein n=1 Tax=Streptomyces sp. NPDC059874 TaxID=3346983 RepID=UPI00365AE26B